MAAIVSQAAARTSLTLLLLAVASGVALTLGAVGIYGVVAYVVSLRTREIAVRLALGARPADVRHLVARQAGVVIAVGIGVGLVGAVTLTRELRALLFDISPLDPLSMLAAAALLGVVAAIATWVPAHRASTLDPAQALRAD
jgi:ABC-type antimicrobial peptide transport system permease subunit